MTNHQVGKTMRRLRTQANITLDILAEHTGFTKGYLSKIERNVQSPPIATLAKIADALNAEIADFFETRGRELSCSLIRKDQRKPILRKGSGFGYEYESIAYKKHNKVMTPFIMTLTPNADDNTIFSHPGEEMMFVLEGVMEFWFEDDRYIVNAGDCLYFDAHIPHRGQCLGESEAKVLVVVCSSKSRTE